MKFKKILLSVFCITSFLFGAEKSIIIGATPTPYAEILNFAKPIFKERGWNLEVKDSITAYFDATMIMADDEKVKNNRLLQLVKIARLTEDFGSLDKLIVK